MKLLKLRVITTVAAAAALALSLSACAGLPIAKPGKAQAEPPSVTIKAVADAARDAGCKIAFSIGFGGATGQLGGGLHAENSFSGSCDPSTVTARAVSPTSVATALSDASGPAPAPPGFPPN